MNSGKNGGLSNWMDHSFYRDRLEKIDGTKAVDILGILENKELYFIEIKDFRKYRIENRNRLLKGELFIEVAQKIRDSIACIVCAHRMGNDTDLWKDYAELHGKIMQNCFIIPGKRSRSFCGWKMIRPRRAWEDRNRKHPPI